MTSASDRGAAVLRILREQSTVHDEAVRAGVTDRTVRRWLAAYRRFIADFERISDARLPADVPCSAAWKDART